MSKAGDILNESEGDEVLNLANEILGRIIDNAFEEIDVSGIETIYDDEDHEVDAGSGVLDGYYIKIDGRYFVVRASVEEVGESNYPAEDEDE